MKIVRRGKQEQCCARYCLSQEEDFKQQKEWLAEVVELLGSDIILYPKFHCELNFIEMLWSQLKNKLPMTHKRMLLN